MSDPLPTLEEYYGDLPKRTIKALQRRKIPGAVKLTERDFIGWLEGTAGYVKFNKVAKAFLGKKLYDEYDGDAYFLTVFFKKLRVKE